MTSTPGGILELVVYYICHHHAAEFRLIDALYLCFET